MKILKLYLALFAMVMAVASCSEAWLDNEPTGATLTDEQLDAMPDGIELQTNGLYTLLYLPNGSAHDYFGQRSIDIVCDLLSSDMGIVKQGYGWFEEDATLTTWQSTASRNSYIWAYYYRIIKNCNVLIGKINDLGTLESDPEMQVNCAQALTMRAYAYYGLLTMYGKSLTQLGGDPAVLAETRLCPYYNENSRVDSAVGTSTMDQIALAIENDLTRAIGYFENNGFSRDTKQRADQWVAKSYLAKLYLEVGRYQEAYETAADVCDNSGYTIIPLAEVTDNGFNNIGDNSWLWGIDVDASNRGGLRSFFGQVDVHSYSYAYSGAYKVMDEILGRSLANNTNDVRIGWFDRQWRPVAKFFPVGKKDAYSAADIDRNWLSDDVLMRIEEIYLVAAEAAAWNNDADGARKYLEPLIRERYYVENDGEMTFDQAEIDEITAMDVNALKTRIYYEIRVELWGEGRSLNAYKRLDPVPDRPRGQNHFSVSQGTTTADPVRFQIPLAEQNYNLSIRDEIAQGLLDPNAE